MKNNLGYAGKAYSWFIGQVPDYQNQHASVKDLTWREAHADRVKVRIPGKHPDNPKLVDDDLPWAIVAKPTSQGNRNGGSTGIWGGEWVLGFFLDEGEQIPIITHFLGNNVTDYGSRSSKMNFARINRFNSGMSPDDHQITGGTKNQTKPSTPAQPTKDDFPKPTKADMIPVYDPNKTYNVGDKVMRNGQKRVFDGMGWAAG